MRAVNLLPSEAQRRSRRAPNPVATAGAMAGVVVVAFVGGGNLLETSRVAAAQRALNDAKLQLAATPLPPAAPKVVPPPAAVAAQMQPRLQAVTSALATRIAWDRILREFSLVLPTDVQLSQLQLSEPSGTGQAANGLQLSGVTFSYAGVARFLSRLALVPDLTDVTLGNTTVSDGVVTFSVSAGVKGAAPVAPAAPLPSTTTTTTTTGSG